MFCASESPLGGYIIVLNKAQDTFKTLPHAVRDFGTAAPQLFSDTCSYEINWLSIQPITQRGDIVHVFIGPLNQPNSIKLATMVMPLYD